MLLIDLQGGRRGGGGGAVSLFLLLISSPFHGAIDYGGLNCCTGELGEEERGVDLSPVVVIPEAAVVIGHGGGADGVE